MKNRMNILGLLLLLYLLCCCTYLHSAPAEEWVANGGATYYYYRGQKMPLFVHEEKANILIFKKDSVAIQETTRFFAGVHETQRIEDERFLLATVEKAVLSAILQKDEAIWPWKSMGTHVPNMIIQPLYVDGDGTELIASGYVNVRLRQAQDEFLLDSVARVYSMERMWNYEWLPLWHTLRITEKTGTNAVGVANAIYETGWFTAAYPDFCAEVDDAGYSPKLDSGHRVGSKAASAGVSGCCTEPDFALQWGLENSEIQGVDISACEAWGWATGKGVNIAVIDEGIYKPHPDLQANIHAKSYDAETGTSSSRLYGEHGTHCAGIAAAAINGRNIAGVAPEAKVMAVSRELGSINMNISAANGISWAWRNGADIISCSWKLISNHVAMVEEAIDSALVKGRNGKGAVVVFSAGNYGEEYVNTKRPVRYPASCRPEILVVSALEKSGNLWNNSCYSSHVDVCAPGVDIYSTLPNDDMGYKSGTSMACPYVSGIAALILELAPELTGQQVRNIIEQSTKKIGNIPYVTVSGRLNGTWNEQYGYGLVDAVAAVQAACQTTEFKNKTVSSNVMVSGCAIEMKDVRVRQGNKLKIEANKVSISEDFIVEEGAELEIIIK